jgi:uncharacterized protein YjbJ (UPF0337 family)
VGISSQRPDWTGVGHRYDLKPNRRNTVKSSTRDNAEGNMHQVRGKIKEVVGKTVGNSNLEAEGTVEKFKGKVQKKSGRIKKALDK